MLTLAQCEYSITSSPFKQNNILSLQVTTTKQNTQTTGQLQNKYIMGLKERKEDYDQSSTCIQITSSAQPLPHPTYTLWSTIAASHTHPLINHHRSQVTTLFNHSRTQNTRPMFNLWRTQNTHSSIISIQSLPQGKHRTSVESSSQPNDILCSITATLKPYSVFNQRHAQS